MADHDKFIMADVHHSYIRTSAYCPHVQIPNCPHVQIPNKSYIYF